MAEAAVKYEIAEEDQLRADWYGLFARLLSGPADAGLLAILRDLGSEKPSENESELGAALRSLRAAAHGGRVESITQEHFDLFVGIGQGELIPYGSYYLTGFLNEKPLAKLRNDMSELGIKRQDGIKEPEDHAGALCEMMAGLIEGDFGDGNLEGQKEFFNKHLSAWIRHFFTDLENAKSSVFYAALGTVGKAFMEIEEAAFQMS